MPLRGAAADGSPHPELARLALPVNASQRRLRSSCTSTGTCTGTGSGTGSGSGSGSTTSRRACGHGGTSRRHVTRVRAAIAAIRAPHVRLCPALFHVLFLPPLVDGVGVELLQHAQFLRCVQHCVVWCGVVSCGCWRGWWWRGWWWRGGAVGWLVWLVGVVGWWGKAQAHPRREQPTANVLPRPTPAHGTPCTPAHHTCTPARRCPAGQRARHTHTHTHTHHSLGVFGRAAPADLASPASAMVNAEDVPPPVTTRPACSPPFTPVPSRSCHAYRTTPCVRGHGHTGSTKFVKQGPSGVCACTPIHVARCVAASSRATTHTPPYTHHPTGNVAVLGGRAHKTTGKCAFGIRMRCGNFTTSKRRLYFFIFSWRVGMGR